MQSQPFNTITTNFNCWTYNVSSLKICNNLCSRIQDCSLREGRDFSWYVQLCDKSLLVEGLKLKLLEGAIIKNLCKRKACCAEDPFFYFRSPDYWASIVCGDAKNHLDMTATEKKTVQRAKRMNTFDDILLQRIGSRQLVRKHHRIKTLTTLLVPRVPPTSRSISRLR